MVVETRGVAACDQLTFAFCSLRKCSLRQCSLPCLVLALRVPTGHRMWREACGERGKLAMAALVLGIKTP